MRWSDMDAYQHINNVAFLGYFEMARVNLFFEHPTHDEKTGMRRGLVVHSHEITYKRSVVYDAEPLEIQIWVSGIRAASFLCHYEAFDHGQLAVTGQHDARALRLRAEPAPPDHPGGEGLPRPVRPTSRRPDDGPRCPPFGTSVRPRTRWPPSSTRTTAAS